MFRNNKNQDTEPKQANSKSLLFAPLIFVPLVILLSAVMIIFAAIITASSLASAIPPLPTEFYGRIFDYNNNASAGEKIYAYDNSDTLCGTFTIINEGFYGSLTCRGDDPETTVDEGATAGENITFKYKGGFTTPRGNTTWGYAQFQYVNLTYPVAFCGDNFCDFQYESYYVCPNDCPLYNASTNITTNATNQTSNTTSNATNQSTGGQGNQSAGGHGTSTSSQTSSQTQGFNSQYYTSFLGYNTSEQGGFGFTCEENWVCTNWSVCRIDGLQNRNCTDKTNCGTFDNRPSEVQKCIYTPLCSDGVKNGLEEGVDCGGLCPPCINCFDKIQDCHDGLCEEGVDCGGPCKPCSSCFDGIKNCHDGLCENGVDCGGSCEKLCPGIQIPKQLFVCKKDFNPLSNQSIIFFIIIILVIVSDIAYSRKKLGDMRKNKSMNDVKRAKAMLSVRRRMYLFVFIVLLISLILYLYYYFFIMCEVEYKFIWILLLLLFMSPLLIHQIIHYLEYTENKRLKQLETLLETHYKELESLVAMENEHLGEIEEEIAKELYRLLERPEFKKMTNADELALLNQLYRELVAIYSNYKEKKNPVETEKLLCDEIYALVEDEKYKALLNREPILDGIISKLQLLYQAYEEKQKIYDEMNQVEASKRELEAENTEKKN